MPDIFDNLKAESAIGPALQAALTNFDRCDVATGYFDLRGWASFADIVDGKIASRQPADPAVVRVLVGMVMPADSALMLSALQDAVQPPPYGSDINDMGKALAAKEQLVKHLRTQLMRGLPSEAEQRTLRQLKAQLQSGAVKMKVFTTAPLHGKTCFKLSRELRRPIGRAEPIPTHDGCLPSTKGSVRSSALPRFHYPRHVRMAAASQALCGRSVLPVRSGGVDHLNAPVARPAVRGE